MDVLTGECFQVLEVGTPPNIEHKFDVIISNPPYSQNWSPVSLIDELKAPPKSKADYAFMPLDSNEGLKYRLEGINRVFLESELIFIDPSNLIIDKEDL